MPADVRRITGSYAAGYDEVVVAACDRAGASVWPGSKFDFCAASDSNEARRRPSLYLDEPTRELAPVGPLEP
jgi:hypothetical protein